jgi:hypothetical protein
MIRSSRIRASRRRGQPSSLTPRQLRRRDNFGFAIGANVQVLVEQRRVTLISAKADVA